MQPTAIILLLCAAISASAYPGALQARQAAGANSTTGPKGMDFACDHASQIIDEQIAQMAKLKAEKIGVPPYLAGYYSALNSGREEIGCPGAIPLGRRETTPTKEPCDVVNDQHERMMVLVNRFEAEHIVIAPFIAGFLSATLDGQRGLSCPPFSGPASEAAAASGDDASEQKAKSEAETP